jgi:hypothetical protein
MGRRMMAASRGRRLAIALVVISGVTQVIALCELRAASITVDPTTTVTYAAVARLPSAGTWRYLTDGSHVKSGFTTIRCDPVSGVLHMHYVPVKNVASVWVSPDETLARRGILAGASVNRDRWRILFTRATASGPRPVSCASSVLRGDNANIWVGLVGQPTG